MSQAQQSNHIGFEFITSLSEDLAKGLVELPAFPEVALRIKDALKDPDVSAKNIAAIAASDPVLSARFLQVANSVMVNACGTEIRDLNMAIARMGLKMAQSTATSFAIENSVKSGASATTRTQLEHLWRHSIVVAAYSYVIAEKRAERINPDEALLAGLLHDIGKFYILSKMQKYPEILESPELLDNIMQDWHTGVGRSIVEAWKFTDDFATVTDEHDSLERSHPGSPDLTDVVLVANLFAHFNIKEKPAEYDWNNIPAARKLGINEESTSVIVRESADEIASIVSALGI